MNASEHFTGERFLPGVPGEIAYEHCHRYAFARRFVAGARVLDAACGEGYGAALLAGVAATALYGYVVHYIHLRLAGVTPLVVTVGSHMVAALLLLPTTLLAWPTQPPPLQAWLAAAGLAVLCTALAYVLFFWVLARVGAARIMVIPYLIPAFGVLWGALLLDEPVSARLLGGCAVILLGTALTTGLIGGSRRSPALAAEEN